MLRRIKYRFPAALGLACLTFACGEGAPVQPEDAEAPVFTLASPQEGAVVRDTVVAVSGTIRDNQEVAGLTYRVGDGAEQSVSVVPSPQIDFNVQVPIAEDANTLTLTAVDAAGLKSTHQVRVTGTVPRFVSVTDGNIHACALSSVGNAYCWGENEFGALGNATALSGPAPVRVAGSLRFRHIAASAYSTCGVTTDHRTYCWGYNLGGLVGTRGPNAFDPVLVPVPPLATVTVGTFHACGLTEAGQAYCWGSNAFGQLGLGIRSDFSAPAPVTGAVRFAVLDAGFRYTCGLSVGAGEAYCWGEGVNGPSGPPQPVPAKVSGGHVFSTISAGLTHVCALSAEGAAYCWGENRYAELGRGTTASDERNPGRVASDLPFAAIGAGRYYTCALGRDGRAHCWGKHAYNPTAPWSEAEKIHTRPTAIPGNLRFERLTANGYKACGLTPGGRLIYCWDRTDAAPAPVPNPR